MRKLAKFKEDLSGQKFGKLQVLKFDSIDGKKLMYFCKCDCGKEKLVSAYNMVKGTALSCGCARNKGTHHMTGTRIHRIYKCMKGRCSNEKLSSYKYYGGKGVKVCEDWINSFENFHEWAMNNGYDETLTLDRIDVNGNYEPSNCRWVTWDVQANNKTNTHYIEKDGLKMNIAQWAKHMNVSKHDVKFNFEKVYNNFLFQSLQPL